MASAKPSTAFCLPSAEELLSLKIPHLRCSFPSLLHPQYEIVREQCEEWILAIAEPPSPAARRFVLACLIPRLACRIIPDPAASVQRLVHVTKMVAWLLVGDDDMDHPDALGSDYDATVHYADLVMAILESCEGSHDDEILHLISSHDMPNINPSLTSKSASGLVALAKLWQEIRVEMSSGLRARFISTMADFSHGLKMKARLCKANHLVDVEAYMNIRRSTSFVLVVFVLIEYTIGIELDQATYSDPLIQQLHNASMDFMNLCNDIISCPIEIGVGDSFNLPSILYTSATHGLAASATSGDNGSQSMVATFQDAVDCVARMTEDLDAHCVSLVSAIQHTKPHHAPSSHAYVAALASCMSGCLAWYLESARYNKPCGRIELYHLHATNS